MSLRKNRFLSFALFFVFTLIVGFTFSLFGQPSNTLIASNAGPTTSAGVGLLITLIPLLVPLVIAIFKYFLPDVPTVVLPILAPIIGALIDFVASKATGAASNPLLSAALGSAGVGLREIYDQVRAKMPGSPQAMTKATALIFCIGLSICFVGCQGKLAPGGAYAPTKVVITTDASGASVTNVVPTEAPDYAFFAVDSSFDFAYAALDAVFTFEQNNRLMLWQISPNIKHSLDQLRPEAATIVRGYVTARASYIANPTPAGLSALQTALSQIQAAAKAAQAAIPSTLTIPSEAPPPSSKPVVPATILPSGNPAK